MTVLPIIERELRAKARSGATYWTRFAVALVGMLLCLPQLVGPGWFGTAASLGKGVFNGIVGAGFVLCCSACLLTADVISSERREGTLGLLLLTRVNRFDVLLGKLGSVGLTSLGVLVVLLPMLMLPVLAGGVMAGEALRKGAGLLNMLFFALGAGLFVSTLTKERPKAVGWALGLVVIAVLAPLAIDAGLKSPLSPSVLGLVSPLFVIIWERGQSLSTWVLSFMIVQAMTWLLLIGAGAGLRRAMREESGAGAAPAPLRPAEASVHGRWPPLQTGANVIEWLVCRQRGLNAAIWTATSISVLSQFLNSWFYRFVRGPGLLGYSFMMLPSLAITLFNGALLAWAASRFFVQARQGGELELLLTTPVGAEAIISGQWRAWKRLLRWPVVVVLVGAILRMLWDLASRSGVAGNWTAYFICWTLLAIAWVLLELGALCWTGLWFGLQAPRPAAAIAWTVGLTRGAPFLVNFLGQWLVAILLGILGARTSPFTMFPWLLPQAATLLFFLWLIRRSKRRLFKRLAGAEPVSLGLWQPTLAVLRKARRWPPT